MSRSFATGKASTSPETWPIFIAYRDDDGQKHARWLFERLNGRAVPMPATDGSGPPILEVFFDKNNPPTDDFLKYNQPSLERAAGTGPRLHLRCSPAQSFPHG